MTQTETLKLAISRLEWFIDSYPHDITVSKEDFLRPFKEALAQPEQEPVVLRFNEWTVSKNDLSDHIYVGELILAGIEDNLEGPEFGEVEIERFDAVIEALQEKLVTGRECKKVPLIAYIGANNTTPYVATPRPKQEPVAWAMLHDNGDFIDAINPEEHARIEGDYKHALYTIPPQRTWAGLTDEEWLSLECKSVEEIRIGLAIQAKLKEKNI